MFFVIYFFYISVNCLNTRHGREATKKKVNKVSCFMQNTCDLRRKALATWVCLRASVNAVLHVTQSFIETRKEYNLFYWILLFLLVFMIITVRGEYICVRAV